MTPPPYTRVLPQSAEPIFDLSVITVCRNVLPQLKRTTASVLGQKAVYPSVSIEHVIVDGASTDGTPEWLAEMKAQGKIETYISEPDRGIYDAMNKGINLARGRVLLYMNADDTLELVDLEPCLAPILAGNTRITGAVTRQYNGKKEFLFRPEEKKMYISCPISHQAFFAETSLYRELGGYRSEMFICSADTDFMYRAANQEGFPTPVDLTVSAMPLGGFSYQCSVHFCDEFVLLLYVNKDPLLAHCRKEAAYCDAIVTILLNHCMTLRNWQQTHSRDIKTRLCELQELCLAVHDITTSRRAKAAMRFAAGPYLSALRDRKQCTRYQWYRLRRHRTACDIPVSNPYFSLVRPYRQTLYSTARFYLKKIFSGLLPRRKKTATGN